jgi:hypothetical protein
MQPQKVVGGSSRRRTDHPGEAPTQELSRLHASIAADFSCWLLTVPGNLTLSILTAEGRGPAAESMRLSIVIRCRVGVVPRTWRWVVVPNIMVMHNRMVLLPPMVMPVVRISLSRNSCQHSRRRESKCETHCIGSSHRTSPLSVCHNRETDQLWQPGD